MRSARHTGVDADAAWFQNERTTKLCLGAQPRGPGVKEFYALGCVPATPVEPVQGWDWLWEFM